jgi:voltage-gated potassium channel
MAENSISKAKEYLKLRDGNSLALLISMLLLIIVFPYFEATEVGSTILVVLFTAVLLSGIYAVSYDVRYVAIGLLLAIPTFITGWSYAFTPVISSDLAWMVFMIVFLVYTLTVVLRQIFSADSVTLDEIYAGISVYVMIGLAFGICFHLLDTIIPGSFKFAEGPENMSSLIYFSFTTLSTAGYGDITPVSAIARSISILEMIVGATYIAVLIGTLMNLNMYRPGPGNVQRQKEDSMRKAEHISLQNPWVIVLIAVMLNYASSVMMVSLDLPFYLDSWGTSLAVLIGGLPAGIIAGVAYNLLMAYTVWGISSWVWIFSSVLVACATWYFRKNGFIDLKKPLGLLIAGGATGGLNAVLAWVIIAAANLAPYAGTLQVYEFVYDYTNNPALASLIEQLIVEIADKMICIVLAAVFYFFLSDHMQSRRAKRKIRQSRLSQ